MSRARVPGAQEAAVLTGATFLLMFIFGPLLAALVPLPVAMVGANLLFMLGPIVLMLRAGRYEVRPSLSLARPSAWQWVGAVALGVSLWLPAVLTLQGVTLLVGDNTVTQTEEGIRRTLDQTRDSGGALLMFAVSSILPGIFEELFFRGLLLPALARQLKPWMAVLLSAIIFGIFHRNLPQGASTAAIGVVLGVALLRGGSVYLTMLAHALHNALILFASFSLPEELATRGEVISLALLLALILLPAGLLLVGKRSAP